MTDQPLEPAGVPDENVAEAVASIQTYAALSDERMLLAFLGAIAAQLALRHDHPSPRAAIEDVLDHGAFDVDDAERVLLRVRQFTNIARRRYTGAGVWLHARTSGLGSPSSN